MNANIHTFAVQALPFMVGIIWAYMLVDWYRFAKGRRYLWLAIILVGGLLGYIFFLFSSDRRME